MSNQDLDKLFESKLGERSFAYNPEAWLAMEQMLDTRKRNYAFYWRSAAAVMVFFGLSLFFALTQSHTATRLAPEVIAYPLETIEVAPSKIPQPISTEIDVIDSERTSDNVPQSTQKVIAAAPARQATEGIPNTLAEQNEVISTPSFAQDITIAANRTTNELPQQKITETEEAIEMTKMDIVALPVLNLASLPSVSVDLHTPRYDGQQKTVHKAKWAYPFVRIAGISSSVNFRNTGGYGFSTAVGLEKPLGKDFSISAALGYTQRNKPGIGTINDSVFYGFGAERIVNEEELQRTHHIELPVVLNYRLGSRHKFGLGATLSYMVAAEASIEREKTKFDRLFQRNQSSENAQMALSNWDLAFHAQYRYLIAPRVSLGTRFQYGINDFAIDIENRQHLTDVRLFLQYAL